MKRVRCVYDKDHMYELQIENTSESDPCSYEVTKAVVDSEALMGLEPMTSVIPVQCSTN